MIARLRWRSVRPRPLDGWLLRPAPRLLRWHGDGVRDVEGEDADRNWRVLRDGVVCPGFIVRYRETGSSHVLVYAWSDRRDRLHVDALHYVLHMPEGDSLDDGKSARPVLTSATVLHDERTGEHVLVETLGAVVETRPPGPPGSPM